MRSKLGLWFTIICSGLSLALIPGQGFGLKLDERLKNPVRISEETSEDFGPRFSPDGSKLVFFSMRSGNLELWLKDLRTGELKQLTNHPAEDRDPSFSPDGKKVVWASKRTGNFDLWVMNLDGSGLKNLTNTRDADEFDPVFSPKRFQLFAQGEEACGYLPEYKLASYHRILFTRSEKGNSRVWSMWEDGRYPIPVSAQGLNCKNPNWSNDNQEIIYECQEQGKSYWLRAKMGAGFAYSSPAPRAEQCGEQEIKDLNQAMKILPTMFLDYKKIAQSEPGLSVTQPSFSSNKIMISATAHQEGKKQLVIYSPEGKLQEVLTSLEINASSLNWSPDGRKLAFTVMEGGKSHIYLADSGFPLSEVINLHLFPELYQSGLNPLLVKNYFVAGPSRDKEFYHLLEKNRYQELPNFLSTDISLQLYHDFYEKSLEQLEKTLLREWLRNFIEETMSALQRSFQNSMPQDQDSYRFLLRYFAVARMLLESEGLIADKGAQPGVGEPLKDAESIMQELAKNIQQPREWYVELKKLDPQVDSYVMQQAKLALEHSFIDFEKEIDYTQFKIRGHYDQPGLRGYFLATIWFGHTWFKLEDRPVYLLYELISKPGIWEKYLNFYQVINQFVGEPDDIGPAEIKKLELTKPELFKDKNYPPAQLKSIAQELAKNFSPKIADVDIVHFLSDPQAGHKVKFRLFPQRFTFDAMVLGRFASPKYPQRFHWSSSLDVMAVLGSDRAGELAMNSRKDDPAQYLPILSEMREQWRKFLSSSKSATLYTDWLKLLSGMLEPLAKQFVGAVPEFVKSRAWEDKTIFTALASYTELKHDTVLYAKQAYGAECGGGCWTELVEKIEWEVPPGYVEPNLKLYQGILSALKRLKAISSGYGVELKGFQEYFGFLTKLSEISAKELKNQPLSKEDYLWIYDSGGTIEEVYHSLSESSSEGEVYGDQKRLQTGIALVADILTKADEGQVLEVAVGRVFAIYVVTPSGGKSYLTKGPIFSFYEFKQDISNRLDDLSWNHLLEENKQPPLPFWTNSFLDQDLKTER